MHFQGGLAYRISPGYSIGISFKFYGAHLFVRLTPKYSSGNPSQYVFLMIDAMLRWPVDSQIG